MQTFESVHLLRECDAAFIPSGEPARFPSGTQISITQSLGGSYTVLVGGRLARIEGKDADALGLATFAETRPSAVPSTDHPLNEESVWSQLQTCYDPEIPVNIVELGLVYDLRITPHPEGGSLVEVKMTLTAPGCGMGAMIAEDAQHKVLALPGVTEAKVELVWDPPWNQAMMTEAAKLQLGLM
jgi:probable FeS assembly SUF system protein SufT